MFQSSTEVDGGQVNLGEGGASNLKDQLDGFGFGGCLPEERSPAGYEV